MNQEHIEPTFFFNFEGVNVNGEKDNKVISITVNGEDYDVVGKVPNGVEFFENKVSRYYMPYFKSSELTGGIAREAILQGIVDSVRGNVDNFVDLVRLLETHSYKELADATEGKSVKSSVFEDLDDCIATQIDPMLASKLFKKDFMQDEKKRIAQYEQIVEDFNSIDAGFKKINTQLKMMITLDSVMNLPAEQRKNFYSNLAKYSDAVNFVMMRNLFAGLDNESIVNAHISNPEHLVVALSAVEMKNSSLILNEIKKVLK